MFTLYQNASNFWIRFAFNFPTNCREWYVKKKKATVCISAFVSDNSTYIWVRLMHNCISISAIKSKGLCRLFPFSSVFCAFLRTEERKKWWMGWNMAEGCGPGGFRVISERVLENSRLVFQKGSSSLLADCPYRLLRLKNTQMIISNLSRVVMFFKPPGRSDTELSQGWMSYME